MVRDAGVALAMRVGGTLLWFGYTVVLARMLSQEQFGLVLFAMNFMLMATPMATLGFETATMRFGSQYWHTANKAAFKTLLDQARLFAALGGGLCTLALLVAAAAGINTPITADWAIAGVVGTSVLAMAIMSVHRDALRGAGRLVLGLMGFTFTRAVLPLVGSIALGISGQLNVLAALALYLGSLGASIVIEVWQISRLGLVASETNVDKGEHLRVALSIWPGEIAAVLLTRASGLVVGLVLNLELAALFLAAQRIMALSQFLTDAIRMAAAPEIARAAGGEDLSKLQRSVTRASALIFVFDLAGKVGMAAFGFLFLMLLGDAYTEAYPTLLVLLLGTLSWTVFGPAGVTMYMIGLQRERSISTSIAALLVIITSWLGSIWGGPVGAAVGFSAVNWLLNGWLVWTIWRLRDVRCGIIGVPPTTLMGHFYGQFTTLKAFVRRPGRS